MRATLLLLSASACAALSSNTSRGIRGALARAFSRGPVSTNDRSDKDLKAGIAQFYDQSSAIWIDTWSPHMHHGYYENGRRDGKDHVQAQVDMVDNVLAWGEVDKVASAAGSDGFRVVDIGCGAGGSSRHIAAKYSNAECTGITLSPVQRDIATKITKKEGLASRVSFQVADAMRTPFEDNSFDVVWSLESGEHMPDKEAFVREMYRICKPGGSVLLVTWCHRDLADGESLTRRESKLFRKINDAYYLPEWCSVADYVSLFQKQGFSGISREDWTDNIAPFWPAVMRSALRPRKLLQLLGTGMKTIKGAGAMVLMIRGYKRGTIKFGLVKGKK